ncbi:armadillo-like helical domain containing protein 1 [Aulostomus maculatus]
MSTREEPLNIGKVLGFLREWDRGDRTVRSRILRNFVAQNTGKTFYELEQRFAYISSLFLARLTTWMKLTYMFGTCLELQLKAIGIYLSASSHDQYLLEFVADGGVLTVLDILNHPRSKEEEDAEALRLLLTVSNAGRRFKEIICESQGVKVIAECLANSNSEETQETAWAMLESLSHGNPKYQDQMYKSLITLLTCAPLRTQPLVIHTLHTVQIKMKTAHHDIVEPLLTMLRSLHLEVQNEVSNLILDLRHYDVRPALLSGLVALLKPDVEEVQQPRSMEEAAMMMGSLPVFVQQAAAAKTIRLLSEESQEVSREFVPLGVIQHLLCAMGNKEHIDAQMQASLALKHFVLSFPVIKEPVQRVMGASLFEVLMSKAETLYVHMDETQAEILLLNEVKIIEGNAF